MIIAAFGIGDKRIQAAAAAAALARTIAIKLLCKWKCNSPILQLKSKICREVGREGRGAWQRRRASYERAKQIQKAKYSITVWNRDQRGGREKAGEGRQERGEERKRD